MTLAVVVPIVAFIAVAFIAIAATGCGNASRNPARGELDSAGETSVQRDGHVGDESLQRYAFSHGQMGTTFNIVLYASDSSLASVAVSSALARIDSLNQRLSDYLVASELNQLVASSGEDRWVDVSDDLWEVLSAAQELSRLSDGAFDVTVGPLTVLWRWAIRRNQLPPSDRLEAARVAVGYPAVAMDSTSRRVRLGLQGMRLDLGGIAKGYAVDEVQKVLRGFGITRVLVDGGGDIRLGDSPPGRAGWRIEMRSHGGPVVGHGAGDGRGAVNGNSGTSDRATAEVILTNVAIATSGSTYKYVEADGKRYSHIIDPRSGMGITDQRLVTVIAPTGMSADALASAISVLGPQKGFDMIRGMADVEVRVLETGLDGVILTETAGFLVERIQQK